MKNEMRTRESVSGQLVWIHVDGRGKIRPRVVDSHVRFRLSTKSLESRLRIERLQRPPEMESKGRVGAPPKEKEKAITKERHPREKQKQKLGDSYLDLGEQGFKSPGSLHMEKDMEDILAQNRVTQEDIDALELPEGHERMTRTKRSRSVLDRLGLRTNKNIFICAICKEHISIKGATTAATRHLKDKHRIIQDEGSKRQKKQNKERVCAETLTNLRKQGEISPDHIAVAVALFAININMPLSMVNNVHLQNLLMFIPGVTVIYPTLLYMNFLHAVQDFQLRGRGEPLFATTYQSLLRTVSASKKTLPPPSNTKYKSTFVQRTMFLKFPVKALYRTEYEGVDEMHLRRVIAQLYVYQKTKMQNVLKPFQDKSSKFHISVDLWQQRNSQSLKFLGIRLFFIDPDFNFKSFWLSCRLFKPAAYLLDNCVLSDVMYTWTKRVLDDMGISKPDLLSATSDAGPEVRRMFSEHFLGLEWQWSYSQLLGTCIVEGLNHASSILTGIREVVNFVNKLEKVSVRFSEPCFADLQPEIMQKKWVSIHSSLERILATWTAIAQTYDDNQAPRPAILKQKKQVQELLTILSLAVDVVNSSGKSKICHSFEFMSLYKLRKHWDNTKDYSAFGKRISEVIRDELDKNFWSKYNSSSDERPWIYDLQALLHPGFRNLNHLKEALKFTPASITKEEIHEKGWQKIKQIAASLKSSESSAYPVTELDFTDLFDSQQPIQHAFKSVGGSNTIDVEIQKYKANAQYVDSKGKPLMMFDGLAEYWQASKNYPSLKAVARCVLAHPVAVECLDTNVSEIDLASFTRPRGDGHQMSVPSLPVLTEAILFLKLSGLRCDEVLVDQLLPITDGEVAQYLPQIVPGSDENHLSGDAFFYSDDMYDEAITID